MQLVVAPEPHGVIETGAGFRVVRCHEVDLHGRALVDGDHGIPVCEGCATEEVHDRVAPRQADLSVQPGGGGGRGDGADRRDGSDGPEAVEARREPRGSREPHQRPKTRTPRYQYNITKVMRDIYKVLIN